MRTNRNRVYILACLILTIGTAWACIWDSDTIDDELHGVPDRQTLVSNRWYRHGPAYYEGRIDRLGQKSELTLEDHDDLAIAYERKNDFEAALSTLDEKARHLEKNPNTEHLYRYHANYGTILAHSGEYEQGLHHLEKAIEINPDAHFGREEFQIHLMRYVIATKSAAALRDQRCRRHRVRHDARPQSPQRCHAPALRANKARLL